jgi:ankyrin repeat protein
MAQISHRIKSELWDACQQGNTSSVIKILKLINIDKFEIRFRFERDIRNMIYIASRNNHVDIVRILQPIESHGVENTLIKYAAQYDSPDVVKFLIEKKAKVDHGALHNAIYNKQEHILQILLDTKVNTNILNLDYYCKKDPHHSLVHTAIEVDQINILQMLLSAKSDINIRTCVHGHTPLYTATKLNNLNMTKILVLSKADIHKKINNGGTPISIAVYNANSSNLEILQLLIQVKADTNDEYKQEFISNIRRMLNTHAS